MILKIVTTKFIVTLKVYQGFIKSIIMIQQKLFVRNWSNNSAEIKNNTRRLKFKKNRQENFHSRVKTNDDSWLVGKCSLDFCVQ